MMNCREPASRDPRRGLPSMVERHKTNVPLKDNEPDTSERKQLKEPSGGLDDNAPGLRVL
jgi:hypothetical protein